MGQVGQTLPKGVSDRFLVNHKNNGPPGRLSKKGKHSKADVIIHGFITLAFGLFLVPFWVMFPNKNRRRQEGQTLPKGVSDCFLRNHESKWASWAFLQEKGTFKSTCDNFWFYHIGFLVVSATVLGSVSEQKHRRQEGQTLPKGVSDLRARPSLKGSSVFYHKRKWAPGVFLFWMVPPGPPPRPVLSRTVCFVDWFAETIWDMGSRGC